ncbi:hypothetical protein [Planococcus shenhongbingii]|uniref:Uncharacterized protein n=1 Tax=Planococcus shenhongbingii TaxID=3058398 RepID=A0ABT8NGT1_9BACL|nr:hypothetical protein [Planococcus sp. N017]MDN7247108.1 hypothetical protein [Planococcus sp. N017]
MPLSVKSSMANKGKRDFSLHWNSIEFKYEDSLYISNLITEDEFYLYNIQITITADLFENQLPVKVETNKNRLKVIRNVKGDYELTSKSKLSISKSEYKKLMKSKGEFEFSFQAKYKGSPNKDEHYNDLLKRI